MNSTPMISQEKPSPRHRSAAVVERFVQRESSLPEDAWSKRIPGASMLHGRAGLAFFFVERFRLLGDHPSLERARRLVASAQALAEGDLDAAFGIRDEAEAASALPKLAGGVLTGWGGIGYVMVLVGEASSDRTLVERGVALLSFAFEEHKRLGARQSELYSGTAGYVAVADDLERRGIRLEPVWRMGEEAAELLVADLAHEPAKGAPLGGAHGRAGELLVLLRRASQLSDRLRRGLDAHRAKALRSGGMVLWPTFQGARNPGPPWSSFCNGVVAHALLFSEAARLSGDPGYLEIAAGAVESLRTFATVPVGTLCCGEAGHAVALHRYGAVASSRPDLIAAGECLTAASQHIEAREVRCLFQGHAGVAFVAMLHAAGKSLFMPLFFEP